MILKKHGTMIGKNVGNFFQLMANLPNAIQMEQGAALTMAGVQYLWTIAIARGVSIMEPRL